MNYPGQNETRKKIVHEESDIEKFDYSTGLWCHALAVNYWSVNEYKIQVKYTYLKLHVNEA